MGGLDLGGYTLTIESGTGGSIAEPGGGTFTYAAGIEVELLAMAKADYAFYNWTGDVGTVADTHAAYTTATMCGDYCIIANFKELLGIQHKLTVDSMDGGNATQPGEGTYTYADGAEVNLQAKPDPGFLFVNWMGDVGTVDDTNDPSTIITMYADCTITANFQEIEYELTINSTDGGNVTKPGEGIFTYVYGTEVYLEAEPDRGLKFVNWTGDVGTVDNASDPNAIVTMYNDYNVTANFQSSGNDSSIIALIASMVALIMIVSGLLWVNRSIGRRRAANA
jgi:hypothetical protein